jgi:hypothetical protein
VAFIEALRGAELTTEETSPVVQLP